MLKIKNDVDLKELEKYGFKSVFYINVGMIYKKAIMRGIEINNFVIGSDRIIHYNQMSVHNELEDVIYDLIQDGLVEKI